MTGCEAHADHEPCGAQVWLPGRLLAELDALKGTDKVFNPYECLLAAGHGGAHQPLGAEVLLSSPGDSEVHWIQWTSQRPPVLVTADFCPEHLPAAVPDPGNETFCQLPVRHHGPHLGFGVETAPGEYGTAWW